MSWKKQGGSGIDKLDNNNNISVNTLVADTLTLKKSYEGAWSVSTDLTVFGHSTLKNGVDIEGTVTISGNININSLTLNKLNVNSDIFANGNLSIGQNISANENLLLGKNIITNGNLHLNNTIFLGNNNTIGTTRPYIFGNLSGIGINNNNPKATFDIYGNNINSLIVYSNQPTNINTLAQNNMNKGIRLQTTDASSAIYFFNDNSMNNSGSNLPNGKIQYNTGGTMIIDVSQNIDL